MNTTILYPLSIIILIAMVFDLQYQRIPNWITFSAMVIGLTINGIGLGGLGSGLEGILSSTMGIFLGIGIFLIPYAMGGMGAGDAKLMGAVGAFLGPQGVFIAALLTMIVGGGYAIVLMIRNWKYTRQLLSAAVNKLFSMFLIHRSRSNSSAADTDSADKPRLCYGVAIAGGTFLYMIMQTAM